jgi:ABC-type branched-subunit amino acid transport system ATPase component
MSARRIEVCRRNFCGPISHRRRGAVRPPSSKLWGNRAVQGIDISGDRTLTALIGPNGAGKTTAFNLLSGMFPPDEGEVSLMGRPIAGHAPEEIASAGIGRSFQITNLFPALSVGENIRLAVQARHPRRFDPITNALSIDAINADAAGMLSHGGQRLLDMGVALATAPRVLF